MLSNRISTLIAGVVLGHFVAVGQCPISPVFSTQASIDAFPTDYPNCKNIQGNVVITENVESVAGLDQLESIIGYLAIEHSTMTALEGFNNLQSCYGVRISNNKNMETIIGFNAPSSAFTEVYIGKDSALTFIDGFHNITQTNNLTVIDNPKLTTINGLGSLTTLDFGLRFEGNLLLTNPGTQQIKSVGGSVRLARNAFSDYTFLSHLKTVGGDLFVGANPNATTLLGLDSVQRVGQNVFIYGQTSMTDTDHLGGLDSVGGNLEFAGLDATINLVGPKRLKTVKELSIWGNYGLENVVGFDSLTKAGSLLIFQNIELKTLPSFQSLQHIKDNLTILSNNNLETIEGLNQLEYVGEGISIESNPELIQITGFNQLNKVVSNFKLLSNSKLTNLIGLDHEIDMGLVEIKNNTELSDCAVMAFCQHLAENRPVTITDNKPGCNLAVEVNDACLSGTNNQDFAQRIVVQPNPVSEHIFIVAPHDLGQYRYTLLHLDGSTIELGSGLGATAIAIENLPMGTYLLVLDTAEGRVVRKVVKS